ncbi:MAG: flagellar hook-length control protein FliK [Mycetocola sp.]
MTVISALPASRASTVAPAASATTQPGAFASILQGILTADASVGAALGGDTPTGDDLAAPATARAEAPMSWPGDHPASEPTADHNGTPAPTDATAPLPASLPSVPTDPALAAAVPAPTAQTPASTGPGSDARNDPAAAVPASLTPEPVTPTSPSRIDNAVDSAQPTSGPTTSPGQALDSPRPLHDPAALASAAVTTSRPAPASLVPTRPATATATSATTTTTTDVGTPSQPTAPATDSAARPLTTAVPVGVPPIAATRGASPAAPAPIAPTAFPDAEAGAVPPATFQPAEATTSVPSPTLTATSHAEPAPAPVPAVSPTASPAPTTATTPPGPAPAPPAQPLNAQLAQPLFSLAGARPGEHVMTVQVTPENLGPVTVRAVINVDGIQIELFSPSDSGREALRQILTDLRRDLAGSGMSASLDLSSKDAQDNSHERAPLHEPPRDETPAAAPVAERRSAQPADTTTTLDITI